MNTLEFIVVMIKLFPGGMEFVAFKLLQQTHVINMEGNDVLFKRSFFIALILFVSVMLAFIPYAYIKRKNPKQVSSITPKAMSKVSISGSCDAAAQICTIIGASKIPVSLVMVLKGSRAIFSAGLSIVLLKKNLLAYQWTSIAICLVGLGIASLGSYFGKAAAPENLLLGLGLVLLAEAFRSVRIVYDERLMRLYNYDPFMIISLEGVTGTVIALVGLITVNFIPGSDMGSYENFANTLYMIGNSPVVIGLLATLPIWVLSMYLSGIFVTKLVSAVYNAIVTVLTVAVVWGAELFVHYAISSDYGNQWTKWSWMQLSGFVLILISTLMYDATWKLPKFFAYPEGKKSQEDIKVMNNEEENNPVITTA